MVWTTTKLRSPSVSAWAKLLLWSQRLTQVGQLRNQFLQNYGHGMLRLHDMQVTETGIDPVNKVAVTRLTLDTEIVPANLPPQFRSGFQQANDPEALRQEQNIELGWRWLEGTWYFELDDEILRGRTAEGTPIEFLDERQGG